MLALLLATSPSWIGLSVVTVVLPCPITLVSGVLGVVVVFNSVTVMWFVSSEIGLIIGTIACGNS